MSREFSLYLDLVRFGAAFLVMMSHANSRDLSTRIIPLSNLGHSAVVVFFVLSGFVIAYVTDSKERIASEYAASRMARIYSVALPALLLTLIADSVGERLQPAIYVGETTHDWGLLRIITSIFFMNEFWGISITTFSNVPYWSLCYEVWYYILFGLFVFWRGPGRWFVLALASILAGAKILLLFPIWLLGVYLWRSRFWTALSGRPAIALYVLSWIGLILFHLFDVNDRLSDLLKDAVGASFHTRMTFSKQFLGDYLLGLLVFINFASFRAADGVFGKLLVPLAKPIRWAASFTLSIYLFHKPLLLFYTALLHGDPSGLGFYFSVVALVLITAGLLALVTEHKKDQYRKFFARAIGIWEAFVRKRFPSLLGQS